MANRVSKIKTKSESSKWSHVKSAENAADVLTRGCDSSLLPPRWLNGPQFLRQHRSDWPLSTCHEEVLVSDPEVVESQPKVCTVTCPIAGTFEHPMDQLIDHFSSYHRLKKSIVGLRRICRFFMRSYTAKTKLLAPVTSDDLAEAEVALVKHVQAMCYEKEFSDLQSSGRVRKTSSLKLLDPVINSEEILVVGGRLKYARLAVRQKHPYLLPGAHKLAWLIAHDSHNEAHLGVEWVISNLRKRFWITQARRLVKSIKRSCLMCKRLYGKPFYQKMGDILQEQTELGKPAFFYVGVDLFGPFYVKQGRSEVKRYGCIYTCLVVRAVHLEVLNSLDTDSFLNGFLRFTARRGFPYKVFSDQGTNLVGARKELLLHVKRLDKDRIASEVAKKGVNWSFNPPGASHRGGLWERCIRTVRRVLCGCMPRNVRLTDETLQTVMCNVESIVNSRPLTKISDCIEDDEALTANHLLLLHANTAVSWGKVFSGELLRKRWRLSLHLTDLFCSSFQRKYISLLQARSKWQKKTPSLKEGDLVLIQDVNAPRLSWPLAKVVATIPGRGPLVRAYRLKWSGGELVRPITKLVILEGDE